jgi:hypothetical protein
MTSVTFSELPDEGFAAALQVTAGRGTGPAEIFVLVDAGDRRICIAIHPYGPQAYPFRDAVIWKDLIVIGFGSALYVVGLMDLRGLVHCFPGYFGSLVSTDAFCLVASDEGVLRLSEDGTALWHQRGLAADGVLISDVTDGVIQGQGQWDAPDGEWSPFRLELSTGRALPA